MKKNKKTKQINSKSIQLSPYKGFGKEPTFLFDLGYKQLNKGNLEDALASFDQVLELKPDNYEAWNAKGVVLLRSERLQEAIRSFDEALKLKPDYHIAWSNRGVTESKFGNLQQAIDYLKQALKLNPNYAEAWYNQGIILNDLGCFEEAIASFDEAIKCKPNYYEAWNGRGALLAHLEQFQEAIISFNKTIEIKPDFHDAWRNISVVLTYLENFTEAVESCEKALKLKPDYYDAWYDKGIALKKLGNYKAALACYDKVVEFKPDFSEAWTNRGLILNDLHFYEDALTSFERALKIDPNFPEVFNAWSGKAFVLTQLLRYEEAIACYDKGIDASKKATNISSKFIRVPSFVDIHDIESNSWHGRGIMLAHLGRHEEAIASYKKGIEIKSDKYQNWEARGVSLYKLMQYQEAIASYDKALEIKPDDYNTWINRAIAISNIVRISHSFILPVTTSYPDLVITFKNPDLNKGGKQGQFASYKEGLKHCPPETHPEGWGKLHRAIGNAHYTYGCKDENPYPHWRKAFRSYQNALQTLTQFPEAHLELLQDFVRCLSALGQTSEAEELQRRATDILQNLLKNTPSPARKQQLALRFAGFQQLTVDLTIQSGNWCAALELAEKGKNACLSWLLYSLGDDSSPTYSQIQNLLSPTTAIIYWHISPNALNTFILKHNTPSPIVISPQISAINSPEENQPSDGQLPTTVKRHREFEAWVQNWNKQYADYREGKDSEETGQTWRENLPDLLADLGQILDIDAIVSAISADNEASAIANLILIPHQDLHRFPLHFLFPEEFTVTYLPSAKIGLSLRVNYQENHQPETTDTSKQLLSVEAPDSTDIIEDKKFEELRHAEMESATISQMFANSYRLAGSDATKENVEKALTSGYKFFHFTGHGTYNFQNPKRSVLALSQTDRLTLEDILQLPFNNYQMVSLSACETAITGNQTITTEYVGLVSAFISKGVRNVVSTLWRVESISSALFAIAFYRQRNRDTAPAAALKRTQRWLRSVTYGELARWYEERAEEISEKDPICATELRDEAMMIKDDPDKINTQVPPYEHPYYWASFIITG
ncbi:CHAT domain-containing protein [Calothrix sp. UHCC 0171]|uniref:CHAT domain-containing protein n=1 Tax=Calothrix sp. UHCC 0171 TaxID=3110245 RepID=UPI002B20E399|nr:tetratricopeptide repeat protein [Calothrix sp. UHCC 0171]MEA5574081.1 tetratricopeptide repeat protein [Calothrix sp. UHCC 0171]